VVPAKIVDMSTFRSAAMSRLTTAEKLTTPQPINWPIERTTKGKIIRIPDPGLSIKYDPDCNCKLLATQSYQFYDGDPVPTGKVLESCRVAQHLSQVTVWGMGRQHPCRPPLSPHAAFGTGPT
jgi:hypothetical protein